MAVDDDKDILELIRMTLDDDYEVVTFHEPMAAIQSIEAVEPDLVVLDIMMPKLTGYQMIEIIKSNRRYADVPVVFLSAKDANRDIKYGYKLGASIYLTKPFQPDRLLRNIDQLFQRTPPIRRAKKLKIEELLTKQKMSEVFGVARDAPTANIDSSPVMKRQPSSGSMEAPDPAAPPASPDPDWLN